MYISICGAPGVGKSTFAKILGGLLNAAVLLEDPEDYPLCQSAFAKPSDFAFLNQFDFILAKMRQQLSLELESRQVVHEMDSWSTNHLWTRTLLALGYAKHMHVDNVDKIVGNALKCIPKQPDIYVFLEADVETLCERILERGREFETESAEMRKVLIAMRPSLDSFVSECPRKCFSFPASKASLDLYEEWAKVVAKYALGGR